MRRLADRWFGTIPRMQTSACLCGTIRRLCARVWRDKEAWAREAEHHGGRSLQQVNLRDCEINDDACDIDEGRDERTAGVGGVEAEAAENHRQQGADERAPKADGGDRLRDDEG